MHKIERIFHPVGQGAFYSETHSFNENNISMCVVYDCGSKKNKTWLKKRISDERFASKNVDILFLSHFHDDHYKGIQYLNPKIIILPLLEKWDKVILWIGDKLKEASFDEDYETKLNDRFRNATIIKVATMSPDPETSDNSASDDGYQSIDSVELMSYKSLIASGCRIRLENMYWAYIPINPRLDANTIKKFKNGLKINGIDEKKLLELDKDYFEQNKKQLKIIYENIGKPNEYSMIVYSGPVHASKSAIHLDYNGQYQTCTSLTWRNVLKINAYPRKSLIAPGCLYLGDIDLNKPPTLLDIIQKVLTKSTFDCIGTIQVPHHGSDSNFNIKLIMRFNLITGKWEYNWLPTIYVIAAGKKNRYGHPSLYVLNELKRCCHILSLVTEDKNSRFTENIYLEENTP